MRSVSPFTKSVAFMAVIAIGAIECVGGEKSGTGDASRGDAGDAGSGGSGGTAGKGGTGGAGGTSVSGVMRTPYREINQLEISGGE